MRQKGNAWVSCIYFSAQQDKEMFLFPLVTNLATSRGIWPGSCTSEIQMMPENSNGHLITAKCLLCRTVKLIVLLPVFLLGLLTNPCYSMACSHFLNTGIIACGETLAIVTGISTSCWHRKDNVCLTMWWYVWRIHFKKYYIPLKSFT